MIWAQVLIVAWLLSRTGMRSRVLALALASLALIPIQEGVSFAMAMRGLWGDPSVTTLQLLLLAFAGKTPAQLRYGWHVPFCIALPAIALYASALGTWDIDLYRLGYQPGLLVVAFAAIALYFWWRGQTLWLWILSINLLAWHAGLLESTNLWDTLLDPLLMFVMVALALRNGYRAHRNRKLLLS